MSGFSKDQLKKLVGKLDRSRVQTREAHGRMLDYIEGWFALSEANAIFGYGGWDREMVHCERVFQHHRNTVTSCGYVARVRVRVRATDIIITREGTGFGHGTAADAGEAHERALKAAETDATKRALATFGNRFGLSLYDRDQAGVTKPVSRPTATVAGARTRSGKLDDTNSFQLADPDGGLLAENLSAEGFCTGMRQLIEACKHVDELNKLKAHNFEMIARLRALTPNLKSAKGEHYADILERLLEHRLKEARSRIEISPTQIVEEAGTPTLSSKLPDEAIETSDLSPPPSRIGLGLTIDKSQLAIRNPRRVRSKPHLIFVASQPCLICEQVPCHAHHVTFAQPRGLSVKVSDEYTVPLCAMHHNELHSSGSERAWWRKYPIDPLEAAHALWQMMETTVKT